MQFQQKTSDIILTGNKFNIESTKFMVNLDSYINKSDNSPIERARKSPNLSTTQMSHGVTNPFIGAFRYRGTLKNSHKPSHQLQYFKL